MYQGALQILQDLGILTAIKVAVLFELAVMIYRYFTDRA